MTRPPHVDAAYRRLDRGWTDIQHGAHGLDVVTLLGHIDALEHRDRQRAHDATRVAALAEQVAAVVGDHDPDRPLAELIVALGHVLDITAPARQETP